MRRLQRNFVVESKFPRKVVKEPTRSIWGDADLKAIARQVEELLPQSASEKDKVDERREARVLFDVPYRRTADELEPSRIEKFSFDQSGAAAATLGLERAAPQIIEKESTANEESSIRYSQTTAALSAKPQSEFIDVSTERLIELEEEHKRLTGTLAELLRAENARIKLAISQLDSEALDFR